MRTGERLSKSNTANAWRIAGAAMTWECLAAASAVRRCDAFLSASARVRASLLVGTMRPFAAYQVVRKGAAVAGVSLVMATLFRTRTVTTGPVPPVRVVNVQRTRATPSGTI